MLTQKLRAALLTTLTVLSLIGCGKEVGRLPFSGEGTRSTVVELSAGDVAFWTDLDIQLDGTAALAYHVDLLQGGRAVASADCSPLGRLSIEVGWSERYAGESQSRSGSGKMLCTARLAKGGPTEVRATLAFSTPPVRAVLNQADLVLKQ